MKDRVVTVNVMQRHIDKGVPSDCWACPIALALADAVGAEVHVFYDKIGDGGGEWTRTLPYEATTFQRRFDRRGEVYPIYFAVRIPAHYGKAVKP